MKVLWSGAEERIIRALGTPAVHQNGVLIFNVDCVEGMKALPAGLVDLTVTSPPYNIGKEYERIADTNDYISWLLKAIDGIWHATTDGGALWLNLGYFEVPGRGRAIPIPYLLWDRVPFYLLQEIVWHYGAGVASRKAFSPRNEKFLWYVKNPDDYVFNLDDVRDPNVKYPHQKKNGKLKCNPLGKNPSDVWEFPKVTSGKDRSSAERMSHPAQFPVAVIDRIVRACTKPGAILLDPFMGSGTVAEVALSTGRCVIGFETQSRYIELISRRLDAYEEWRKHSEAQSTLFDLKKSNELSSLDCG